MNIKKYSFPEFSRENIAEEVPLTENEFEKRIQVFNEIFTKGPIPDDSKEETIIISPNLPSDIEIIPDTIGASIEVANLIPKQHEIPQKVERTYNEGFADGMNQAKIDMQNNHDNLIAEQNSMLSIMLEKIDYWGSDLAKKFADEFSLETAEFMTEIASKISGSILKRDYVEILQSEINNVLSKIITSQSVTIELHPQTSIKMRPIIMSRYENQKFKIEIVDNNELEVYDCLVSWGDGAFEFIRNNRAELVKNIVKQFISQAKK